VRRYSWAIQEITPCEGVLLNLLGFFQGTVEEVTGHLQTMAGECLAATHTIERAETDRLRVFLTRTPRQGAPRRWQAIELLTRR
jgi:hypothetical protein